MSLNSLDSKRPPHSKVLDWLGQADRILRGDATRLDQIQDGELRLPVVGISLVVITLGIFYGGCMGIYALIHGAETSDYTRALLQTLASMSKVPLLFFLTLVVTFPSLYVFNALVGSQLRVMAVLKLLIASLVVNLAVLASMGPILAFFSASTPNYSFIVLLNVLVFAVAGALGLTFLLRTLHRLSLGPLDEHEAMSMRSAESNHPTIQNTPLIRSVATADAESPLERLPGLPPSRHVRNVFACWIVLFGTVGAQMGWLLRPFIGSPDQPFQWFRERDSNFFESVMNSFWNLFGLL